MHSEYITSAAKANQLPVYDLPELAFVGRSNCGKSTLLNALLNHKDLARTSRTPGRTQMVNFFKLNQAVIFADLPGYGFSATGKESREHWFELLNTYFERKNIRYVLFLADARRKMDAEDNELMAYLAKRHELIVVLTKADKLNRTEQAQQKAIAVKHLASVGLKPKAVFLVSSPKKTGIEELRNLCLNTEMQSQP